MGGESELEIVHEDEEIEFAATRYWQSRFRAGARPWPALFEGTAGFFEAAVAETLEERKRGG